MLRTLIATAALVALGCANQSGLAEQDDRPVHIRIQVRQMDGYPIAYLRKQNFRVTAAGQLLPITNLVHNPKQITRILVLISAKYSASGSSVDNLLEHLPVSLKNEQISLVEASGAATGFFTTRVSLSTAIHAARAHSTSFQQALDGLATYTGPRAVIYMTSSTGRTPPSIRKAAAGVDALIYQVGGDPADNYDFEPYQTSAGPLTASPAPLAGGGMDVLNTTEVWESGATLSIRDVYVERSIQKALSEIAWEDDGYYDLQVTAPLSAKILNLSLTIKGDYQISAQTYSFEKGPVPSVALQYGKVITHNGHP